MSRTERAQPGDSELRDLLRDLFFPVFLCGLLLVLLVQPAFVSSVGSRPAFVAETTRHVGGGSAFTAGRFLLTVVRPRSVNGRAGVEAKRAMDKSRKDALRTALDCVGSRGHSGDPVEIRSRGLTGPSAGLMFALSLVDRLSPEDITHGRRIAGTGTISSRGDVGAVGELRLKAQAAERAKADLFLVPNDQARQARRYVTSLPIVGVDSLDEALRALGARGCRP